MNRAAVICLAVIFPSGPLVAQGAAASNADATAEGWIVSETTSPLDYAPVIIASALSDDRTVQLSIQCRRGRTDLMLASPQLTGRPEDYRVTYTVDNGRPAALLSGPAASGTGISVRDDVVRLLTGLPDRGDIAFQIAGPRTAALQARFPLGPLRSVVDRIAGPCKWPVTGLVSPQAKPK